MNYKELKSLSDKEFYERRVNETPVSEVDDILNNDLLVYLFDALIKRTNDVWHDTENIDLVGETVEEFFEMVKLSNEQRKAINLWFLEWFLLK